jgi:hypothetical protein
MAVSYGLEKRNSSQGIVYGFFFSVDFGKSCLKYEQYLSSKRS